jgi:uncharacterized protein (TIGR03435 family)
MQRTIQGIGIHQSIAPGYIHAPVLDATGLEGGFDFTLSFSPTGLVEAAGKGEEALILRAAAVAGTPVRRRAKCWQQQTQVGPHALRSDQQRSSGLKPELQKRPVQALCDRSCTAETHGKLATALPSTYAQRLGLRGAQRPPKGLTCLLI